MLIFTHINKLNFINLFFSTMFILGFISFVHCEWKPEYVNPEYYKTHINDCDFQDLKNKVINYLKDSWCSVEKANLLMELVILNNFETCVEIGAFTGSTILPVAVSLKYLNKGKIYAIDAWSNIEAIRGLEDNDPNKKWWAEMNMNVIYSIFEKLNKDWQMEKFCIVKNEASRDAIKSIQSIDFLHIDGNYSEQGSLEDVELYLPKVKKGGYILYSNLGWVANQKLPRIKAFQKLLDSCEIFAIIDNRNSFLLKKIFD